MARVPGRQRHRNRVVCAVPDGHAGSRARLAQDGAQDATSRDGGSAVPSETLTASELWVAQRGRPVLTVIDGDGELVSPMHRASLRVV